MLDQIASIIDCTHKLRKTLSLLRADSRVNMSAVLFMVSLLACFSVHGTAGSKQWECAGRSLRLSFNEGLPAGSILLKFKQYDNVIYSFYNDSGLGLFQISSGGTVTNIVRLDREDERGSEFTLTVLATRRSQSSWIYACSLTVTILDINDNIPQFQQDLYVGYVQENSKKGTLVQGLPGVYATDLDTDSVHSYKILPGNGEDKFEAVIQELSGIKFLNIRTKVVLDREETAFYVLTVQALDGRQPHENAQTQVRINVDDLNDCTPVFSASEYSISMLITTPVSSPILKIHAHDCDAGQNAAIYYFFKTLEAKRKNYFTLDPHTGVIRVATELDRKYSGKVISLAVVAQDRGEVPRSVETIVNIHIYRDLHFIPPLVKPTPSFIRSSYFVRVREDLPLNSHILLPDVTAGSRFSILSSEPIPFQVDVNSGVIYVVKRLDYESRREYKFRLFMTQNSEANVTVVIDDANENFHNPLFDQVNLATKFNRNWNQRVSHFIHEIRATDLDEGLDGDLEYFIQDGDAVGRFTIHSGRRLHSVPGLNWDGVDQLGLVIEARDKSAKWKSARQFLLIDVVGRQDCAPVFNRPVYRATIREHLPRGSFVTVAKARACQDIEYHLLNDRNSRNNFKIDKYSGILSTKASLDREQQKEYSLEIVARNGSTSSRALVVINIDDINDHDPEFLKKNYEVEITENRGRVNNLLCLVANDKDGGENGKVKYEIVPENDLFHIDVSTGALASESLNFEDNRVHELTVKATDNGDKPRSSTTIVKVLVKNVNDPPRFQSNEITVEVIEEQPVNTRVVFLSVHDEDVGKNGEFDCSYDNIEAAEFGKFRVLTTDDGCEVQNSVLLKWHEGASYSLQVKVTDRAFLSFRKSDIIKVNVKIKDVNNHDPVFTQDSYWSSLPPAATSILKVTAEDLDGGRNAKIEYSLASKSDIFKINSTTGRITAVRGKLRVGKHQVDVYAEDKGSPKRRSKVTCHISIYNSVNRFPFKMTMSRKKVFENVPTNSLVTTVRVKARVNFFIVGGNTGQAFSITHDGKITVARSLDYEQVKEYKLVIRAVYKPRGLELAKEQTLDIEILDIDDNEPRFAVLNNPLVINIYSAISRDMLLAKVTAIDADSADTIIYRLKPSSPPVPFEIHSLSGEITAFESVQDRKLPYSFTVVAQDKDSLGKRSELEVHVRILGGSSNLNIPAYQLTGFVNEGSLGKNRYIMSFSVKNGQEQDLTYSISNGNYDNAFCVDSTGALYAVRELDRESRDKYVLSVSVDDGVNLETSDVVITVSDVNDNHPQFPNDVISVSTEENTPAQKISELSAKDWDSGMNGNVTYRIVSTSRATDDSVFTMDNDILMITRALNHEEAASHVLTIAAEDRGFRSYKTFAHAIIRVQDKNDHRPSFLSRHFAQRVSLLAPRGYQVLRIRATDADSGANGEVRYNIHSLSTMFAVDELTGWITVASELTHGSFTFNVTAMDRGTPSLSDTASVTVTVEVNAGPPRFISPQGLHASVEENQEKGTLVLKLNAVSEDLVTYALYQTNTTDFHVDAVSGEIFTSKPLDYENIKYYEITVSATDRSERMSLAQVRISVDNVNDNRPMILDYEKKVSVRIRDDASQESLLMKIRALDNDDDDDLTFSLTQDSNLFKIDPTTGEIRSRGSLQGIRDNIYLAVTVRDRAGLEDALTVIVVVVKYDERLISMEAEVSEDTEIGKYIPVTPIMTPQYKKSQYTIIYPFSSPFNIHNARGTLSLKSRLDYEQKTEYELTVRIEESGAKSNYFDVDLKIVVKDENDNAPKFVSHEDLNECKNRPEFKIHENAQRGSLVYKFEARDRDSGFNGQLFYVMEQCKDCTHLFSINKNTGELETTGVFMTKPQYKVNVLVYDKGIPTKSTRACILVRAGRWEPEFTKEEYHFNIDESTHVHERVGEVQAQGFGTSITYELANPSAYFSLNPTSGVLSLKSLLDYEISSQRRFELVIVTKNQASRTKVIVNVRDVNDCTPKFEKSTYTDHVPETAPIGSALIKLHAVDGDSGLNADIRYSIDSKEFLVDPFSGVVFTAAVLDYETKREFRFTVTAHDRGNPSQVGKTELVIKIVNMNDNRPMFTSQKYFCSVWENAKAGSVLTTVKAIDADGSKVMYEISGGNNAGVFAIDRGSGVLELTKSSSLVGPYYNLNISATDGVYRDQTVVRVNIKDINDHPPVFTKCSEYHPSIPEDAPLGTTVLQVSASDEDLGPNGLVEYDIVVQQRESMFRIDPTTGRIVTKAAKFDREESRKFSLLVKATDGRGGEMKPEERLEGSCSLEVTITDVNDNEPRFDFTSYSQNVIESAEIGHSIVQVKASDLDEGQNAMITYSFKKHSDLFFIEPRSGVIKTRASLMNKKNRHSLRVLATDHGDSPLSSEVDVIIHVTESDDKPQFLQSFYEVSIPENFTRGLGQIARVTATSKKRRVYYVIERGNTPGTNSERTFDVDANGVIRLSMIGRLDRETTPEYTLKVRAEIILVKPLSSYAIVRIVLTDVNDCLPEFTLSRYDGTVSENVEVGTAVLSVSASDCDMESTTVFSMSEENPDFKIDRSTGLILTKQVFDREEKSYYSFEVQATDQDNPRFTSTVRVYVRITDVNDLSPKFEYSHYARSVEENANLDTVIGTVAASDDDVGGKITYSIKSGDIDGVFRIDPDSGQVLVNGNIDYETTQEYNLTLGAWDGKHEVSTVMTIRVKDENDHSPVFNAKLYEDSISENRPKGTVVTSLLAIDPDDAEHIKYELSNPVGKVFYIAQNSNQIKTLIPLDREYRDTYIFEAYARDREGKTGSVTVKIHVLDENDNAPVFLKSTLTLSVRENELPNTTVGRIQATDRDDVTIGNGKVRYGIIEDDAVAFTIDRDSGVLRTRVGLDRESKDMYKLRVNARDGGVPPRWTWGEVTVRVLDDNDHSPQFDRRDYHSTIAEDASLEAQILQLSASDKDVGVNANLSFTMLDYVREFRVHPTSGLITLAAPLDYEKKTEYKFNVRVEDGGKPRKFDIAQIEIQINDSNDCDPVFKDRTYIFVLDEGFYEDQKLVDLRTSDADGTERNRDLQYSISEDAEQSGAGFVVDPITGELFVNTKLDFERREVHTFKVRATNLAYPYRYDEAEVRLLVRDINDNPPELDATSRDLKIWENSGGDHVTDIGHLHAYDRDKNPNGEPFTFRIVSSNEKNLFELDSKTGLLRTRASFDREEQALYVLEVSVEDSGTPALTNNITIRIHVTDRNDNQHKEGHLSLSVNIFDQQTISAKNPIGRVFVDDRDTDDLRYYNVLSGDNSTFSVDTYTGNITMNKQPTSKEYNFRVRVADRNSSFHPVECTIRIHVNIIPSEAFSRSITLRFLKATVGDVVTNIDVYKRELARALKTIPRNVDIFSVQRAGSSVDMRLAAHGSPYYAPERLVIVLAGQGRRFFKHFQNVLIGYDACTDEPCETGGCRSVVKRTGRVRTVDNGRGTSFASVETGVEVKCDNCKTLFPWKTSCNQKPCFNSGVCQDSPRGYLCTCPEHYQGENCELTTRSFKPGDWVWLQALKSCSIGTLSLEFSTLREDGLLFYAGPTSNWHEKTFDFLVIQLNQGKVVVKFSLGDRNPSLLMISKSKKLNDGEWHMVEIYHNATTVRVVIDQCNSSSLNKSRRGFKEDRSNCEQRIVINDTKFRSLDIKYPVQLGGMLGSPPDYMSIRPITYDGCIRNVRENGILMDLKDILDSKGSQEGCPVIDQHCRSPLRCSNNASCVASRRGYSCVCPPGYEGKLCANESVGMTFTESSFVRYRPQTSFLKTYQPKFTKIQMMIRSRDKDGGPLLMIRDKKGPQSLILNLTRQNHLQSLEAKVNLGKEDIVVRITNVLLSNGHWHHVTFTRNRNEVLLEIKSDKKTASSAKGRGYHNRIWFEMSRDTEIILGSVEAGNGFNGCMKDVRLNGQVLLHSEAKKVFVAVERKEVMSGCHSRACEGVRCRENYFCHDKWRAYSCLKRLCKSERPCWNRAECHDYGEDGVPKFECRCRTGFSGRLCENGSDITWLRADEEMINVKLVVGLSCFVVVLVLATLLIVCYHRHQSKGKATFDGASAISKRDKKKDSSKRSLVVVEWSEAHSEANKTNNSIKNQPRAQHSMRAHVQNSIRSIPVKTHPLEPEVTEHKPLAQLPAWDIPPMIDIVLSPDSDSSPIVEDSIEDPDETWQDAESRDLSRPYDDRKPSIPDDSPSGSDEYNGPTVTWNDIEEYGRKFYKLTRNFLAKDEDTRPASGVSTTSNSSSVVTVVENPLT